LTSPELCFPAPMSPRTVFLGNHIAEASDNASPTS
jgi:hypothetical protein